MAMLCHGKKSLTLISIVFTSWRRTLDRLETRISHRNIKYVLIDRRVNGMELHQLLSCFQDDPYVRVLLMSLEIVSVG